MKNLEDTLRSLSSSPVPNGELEKGVRCFVGAVKCLLAMKQEILDREGGNFDKGIDKGAGRGTQSSRPKYTPVRIC